MVWTVHNSLRGDIRTAFADILEPQLVALLQQLQPLRNEVNEGRATQQVQHNAILSEFRQCQGTLQAIQASSSLMNVNSDQHAKEIIAKLEMQDVNMMATIEALKTHILTSTQALADQKQQTTSTSLNRVSSLRQRSPQVVHDRPQDELTKPAHEESINKL